MTKNLLKYIFLAPSFALGAGATAHALACSLQAPEVDPSLTIGGLTLLAGTIAVLRVRRKK